MESVKADGEDNKELDDSGYVQDEGPPKSSPDNANSTNLLDLSDDVLLCIFSYCRASDLKALGYSCSRLAALIKDRTLWQRVDARDRPYGRKRLRWLLDHALHAGTTHLYLKGYAEHWAGCEGFINSFRAEIEEKYADLTDRPCSARQYRNWIRDPNNPLPRASASPSWPDDDPPRVKVAIPHVPNSCPGPHFTLTPCLLRRLQRQCNITHLQADLININCTSTPLSFFPSTLTHLSLRGTRCYNVPNVEKSFLFKIQDHLPNLEYLDLSENSWLEPSCLLPLSKLPKLRRLFMTNCPRMTEFVAYASLAGRYGFKTLQVLDLRGSPIGDSEAAALGWLPRLEELYLSSAPAPGALPPALRRQRHHHYKGDELPEWQELCCWEIDEPPYFKKVLRQQRRRRVKGDPGEKCCHNLPFHKCMDGYSDGDNFQCSKNKLKRKNSSDEPGPSKRKKTSPPSSESDDYDDDDEEMVDDLDDDFTKSTENVASEDTTNEAVNNEGNNVDASQGTVNNEGNNERNAEVPNVADEENNGGLPNPNVADEANNGGQFNPNGADEANNGGQQNPNVADEANNDGQQNRNGADEANDGGLENAVEEPNIDQLEGLLQINHRRQEHVILIQGNINVQQNNEQRNNVEQPNNEQAEAAANRAENNEQPNVGDQQNNREQPNNGDGNNQAQGNREGAAAENIEARPRAQVLYINLGRQNHPIFRAVFPGADIAGPLSMEIRMPASHMPTLLISDSSIRSFGNSDDDNVNYFHIGGAPNPQNARPSKSNLRILSVQGYKKITDRSLMHLKTSAPKLEVIDFTETSVTEKGVEKFRRRRPEVRVYHSRFVDRDGPLDCRIAVDG